jgi:hypothetical protein
LVSNYKQEDKRNEKRKEERENELKKNERKTEEKRKKEGQTCRQRLCDTLKEYREKRNQENISLEI